MFLNWVPHNIQNCLHCEQETNFLREKNSRRKSWKNLTLTEPTRDVENKNLPF